MKRLAVLFIALVVLASGCSLIRPYAKLSPQEKAIVGVEAFSSWYFNTHQEVDRLYQIGDAQQKEWINKNVSPKMDAVRPLIIKYNELVLLWKETNMQPKGYAELVAEIERLMLGIITTLQGGK